MQKMKTLKYMLLATVVALFSINIYAQEEQGAFAETNWSIGCDLLEESQKFNCSMDKSIINTAARSNVLTFSIRQLIDEEGYELIVRVPHGVNIPNGVKITVDEEDVITLPYLQSDVNGVLAASILEDEINKKFMRGTSAVVSFLMSGGQNLNVSLSLSGYTASMNRLEEK